MSDGITYQIMGLLWLILAHVGIDNRKLFFISAIFAAYFFGYGIVTIILGWL